MAAGDVTVVGPYNESNIQDAVTALEALPISSLDQIESFVINGSVFFILMEES